MDTLRRNWLLVAVASGAALLWSGVVLARRIEHFHEVNQRQIYFFQRVQTREFSFAQRPVRLADDLSIAGTPYLVLHYGDRSERIRATVPPEPGSPRWNLPDLLPHDDWLRVLRMAPGGGLTPEEFRTRLEAGQLDERLILVARIPNPGADPRTWGSVWKKDWSFDFHELTRDGEIVKHPRLRYPTTRGVKAPREGELHENTWQFQAALQTMPQAGAIGPTHNFFGNALAAAGWMLPLAAFSGLLCTLAIVFAFAPPGRAGPSWRTRPA